MTNNAHNDLAYIRELMIDTRRAASLSGGYFIVWGLVTGLAIIATWFQIATDALPYSPLITWSACLIFGALGSLYLVWKDSQTPVKAPAGRLIGMVWAALGGTQIVIFFAGMSTGALPGEQMPALFSAIIGTGVFLTGVVAGLGWLRNLAFGWWAGAALMFIWPGQHVMLIMGVMLLAFYVVPGLILIRIEHQRPVSATEA